MVLSDAGTLKRLDIKHIQNTPAFHAYLNSNQTISDATWTKVAVNTEIFDSDGEYDNTTNYRFTPTTAGKYLVSCSVMCFGGSGTVIQAQTDIQKNGSGTVRWYSHYGANYVYGVTTGGTAVISFNGSGDYIELFQYMDLTTGSPTIQGHGARPTYFGAVRIAGV
jgi:hypothetical protein